MPDVKSVVLIGVSDTELLKISKDNTLSLTLEEMKIIQQYFKKMKRNPTDAELETIAQTWSEHCKHKTLTGLIEYKETKTSNPLIVKSGGKRVYDNLLKETVFRVTKELNKKWCISVFKDNAGIIEFDKKNGVAFKVETHNHPSALEPYGGSATGIGGVIRDILGVGLGAKPIANTDIFCFGLPDMKWSKLPQGVLHPKRIAKGVVAGVRDYGNRMGIPTVNGSVYFDEGYASNPLVYCGTVGMIPKDKCFKKVKPGDLILIVGGRTGRDGIHGATFSSVQLDQESDVGAVQIGNPIVEKKVLDTILKARDLNLYNAITDCGAGGFSSAIGELGEVCGAKVYLEKIPLKYEGLKPWEIWLSEAQERMVLAVAKENKDKILKIFNAEDVEATFVGEFTRDGMLTVIYENDIVVKLQMDFLHNGVPRQKRIAMWHGHDSEPAKPRKNIHPDYNRSLRQLLSSLNICSKEWIIRQYDHEVQGQTVVKPLHGNSIENSGPGDAAVIWPFATLGLKGQGAGNGRYKGIVLSNGLNPEYGKIDPYWMAASAIDEALRNAVCVGGDIEQMALLDNFCWGNPNRHDQLAGIVRASQACYDMAKVFGTPFISGKDSLHNEYLAGDKLLSIPAALLISAIGIVKDIRKTITMNLKKQNNQLYVVGLTKNEMGGSHYNKIHEVSAGDVPTVDAVTSKKTLTAMAKAIHAGVIASCHDCSEGGLAVALAEMAIAGNTGVDCTISAVPAQGALNDETVLFSESNSRFVVEIFPENKKKFEHLMKGIPLGFLGTVTADDLVHVQNTAKKSIIKEKVKILRNAWRETLNW